MQGAVWESVEPPSGPSLKQVSVGIWSVWVVNQDGKPFVRKEVTSVFPEGTHWQAVSDTCGGSKDSGWFCFLTIEKKFGLHPLILIKAYNMCGLLKSSFVYCFVINSDLFIYIIQ